MHARERRPARRSSQTAPRPSAGAVPQATSGAREPLSGFHLQGATGASVNAALDMGPVPQLEGLTPRQILALQETAGNRAVSSLLGSVAQRVPMSSPNPSETLYNQTNATGQATAKSYGGGTDTYDMARTDDTGVTVTVRIRFLNQSRCAVPRPAGAPSTVPDLGDLIGSPTEIPADDPDNRRAWATDMAGRAVAIWNGRLTLAESPAAAAAGAAAGAAGAALATTPPAPAPAGGVTPRPRPAPRRPSRC